MAKTVFTVVERNQDLSPGWQKASGEITAPQLEKGLPDESQGSPKRSSTAIPTPFGRIHLLESAFQFVKHNPEGRSQSHALVSQCWDLLQFIFFSRPTDAFRVEVEAWKKKDQLELLTDKGLNARSRLLGDTLNLFFQDSQFADTDTFYLLSAVNKEANLRLLLGATSPLTLVFTHPNLANLRRLQVQRRSSAGRNQGFYFDQEIISFAQRSKEFQEYIYYLFITYPQLKGTDAQPRCKAVYDTFGDTEDFKNFERDTQKVSYVGSLLAPLENEAGSPVDVMTRVPLMRLAAQQDTSDYFLIPSVELKNNARPPLVLKPDLDALRSSNYFNGTSADDRTRIGWAYVGEGDEDNLEERVLPTIGTKYPFLTVNDFLTEYLVELPYELDTERFYCGKIKWAGGASPEQHPFRFLLPLKRRWFQYFAPTDLNQRLECTVYPDRLNVRLAVPVGAKPKEERTQIVYERDYYLRTSGAPGLRDLLPAIAVEPGEKGYKGGKLYAEFSASIFPFHRFGLEKDHFNNLYFVQLADNSAHGRVQLKFFDGARELKDIGRTLYEANTGRGYWSEHRTGRIAPSPTASADPTKQAEALPATTYFHLESGRHEEHSVAFDFIQVELPAAREGMAPVRALIVPRWRGHKKADGTETKVGGGRKFTFAVDFGTTSTHVAYVTDDEATPVPLRVDETDRQSVTLYRALNRVMTDRDEAASAAATRFVNSLEVVLHREFVPMQLNAKGATPRFPVGFPIRTATCEAPHFIDRGEWMLFGDINIGTFHPYDPETDQNQAVRTYKTNLKWETSTVALGEKRVRAFFRELLLLIKHEVALNSGDLDKTSLAWSKPLSLNDEDAFTKVWESEFRRVFAVDGEPSGRVKSLSESWAPYAFLSSDYADLPGEEKRIIPAQGKNVVTIDIGGGTTDILLLEGRTARKRAEQSFQFAGDVLWGDKSGNNSKIENGFLQYYLRQAMTQNFGRQEATKEAWGVITSAAARSKSTVPIPSTEIVGLLFAFDKLKFIEIISSAHKLRAVLLLHYGAIIYHVGQVCAAYGMELPRHLAFSGKGSMYLRMLAADSQRRLLTKLTRKLLEFGSGQTMPETSNIDELLKLAPEPKEITAKGAALWLAALESSGSDPSAQNSDDENLKAYFVGDQPDSGAELPRRRQANFKLGFDKRKAVLTNVRRYLEFITQNDEIGELIEDMKIVWNSYEIHDYLLARLEDSFDAGIERMEKEQPGREENRRLTQTLFFLPLRDSLTQLCTALAIS